MKASIRQAVIATRKAHPDRPILTCYWDARRWEHFRATLKADVAAHKKRSKAAKRGWKARRAREA